LPDSNDQKEVLAIIPARGGSKGIPRKNIADLCGKPLIAYSIEVALRSHHVSRVIVSTDDEEIAEVSRSYGAEVPFLRPKKLSHDRAAIAEALRYTINRMQAGGYQPDAVINLYPTHPFRSSELVDFLIGKLFDGYQTVKTVRNFNFTIDPIYILDSNGILTPLFEQAQRSRMEKKYVRSYGTFMGQMVTGYQPYGMYLHYLDDPVSLIDIDEENDLVLARKVVEQGQFDY
jgi:CMP-N-acetylneuraminic acid synthetase